MIIKGDKLIKLLQRWQILIRRVKSIIYWNWHYSAPAKSWNSNFLELSSFGLVGTGTFEQTCYFTRTGTTESKTTCTSATALTG